MAAPAIKSAPNCPESEIYILAAIIMSPEIIPDVMSENITPAVLYDEKHRIIMQTLLDVSLAGGLQPNDTLTLIGALKDNGKLRFCGGAGAIAEIADSIAMSEGWKYHAGKVLECVTRRQQIEIARDLFQAATKGESIEELVAALTASSVRRDHRVFVCGSEMVQHVIQVDWLIDGFLEKNTTGQTFGPPGSGKSFTVLDRALCIATGEPWHGRKVRQGLVLYLCGEGFGGIRRRVKAWLKAKGKEPGELTLFHVTRRAVVLDAEGAQHVISEVKALQEKYQMPVAFIAIDTVARHLQGDENKTEDMNLFVQSMDSIRGEFNGSVIEAVHHTGHNGDRSRGSSALKGAVDYEIFCKDGCLTWTKMKDGDPPAPIEFTLSPVEIGRDYRDEPITSCVPEYGRRSEQQRQTASFTPTERDMLRALVEASITSPAIADGQYGSLIGDWRAQYYERRKALDPDENQNTRKKAFLRGVDALADKGGIAQHGHVVIPCFVLDQTAVLRGLNIPLSQAGHLGDKAGHSDIVPTGHLGDKAGHLGDKITGHGTPSKEGRPRVPVTICPAPPNRDENQDGYFQSLVEEDF